MSEQNWTKGPWKSHAYNQRMGSLISWGDISKGESIAIAVAQKDAKEGIANANLIAAAPEMYEALACLIDVCDGNYRELTDEMQLVLAKARGEK